MRYSALRVISLLILGTPLFGALKAPAKEIQGALVNDLPAPYNLQAITTNRAVALQWNWQPPEQQPLFTDFGYEILRQDGAHFVVSSGSYADLDLNYGHYSYKVRVRGGSKEHGKRVNHVSSWSESVDADVHVACPAAPRIELKVEPTQRTYNSIPSLRMHLTGRIPPIEGCTLKSPTYHIDAETGLSHSGTVIVDSQGRFDDFADAVGPEDEAPAGETTFTVTVSAENEAGPSTSNAYSVGVHLQNKFAPQGQ
jgi:hypothetical protein